MWLVCKTRAKILLSDPETSLTTLRLLPFLAIETIIWKLPITPVVQIVSKYFEMTGAIGTIRMIIWKPGLNSEIVYPV